jgi:hypothetical protein
MKLANKVEVSEESMQNWSEPILSPLMHQLK